jgi:putative transposase
MVTPLYASDLTAAEWALLGPRLRPHAPTGRLRLHSPRTILNALFYQLRTGGAWRFLPQEWPPWKSIEHDFRSWRVDGTWERLHTALRARLRIRLGREAQPSAASMESQAVKTTGGGGRHGDDGGDDGGQQVKGRQRHLLVDTAGLVLRAVVPPANLMDRNGVKLVLHGPIATPFPRLRRVGLDAGDNGTGTGTDWIEQTLGGTAQSVQHPPRAKKVWAPTDLPPEQIDWSQYLPPPRFRVLPRRWVVERTLAWQGQQRRLSKDYERLCATSEALISITMIRLMIRRLARF